MIIESTEAFEKDLAKLGEKEKDSIIDKINDCVRLFPDSKAAVYRKMYRPHQMPLINGYESSLYILRVTDKLRIILAIDQDPIFDQTIFTLFRVIPHDKLDRVYKGIAESLYQDLLDQEQDLAKIS